MVNILPSDPRFSSADMPVSAGSFVSGGNFATSPLPVKHFRQFG
jgi:hypothetical protein